MKNIPSRVIKRIKTKVRFQKKKVQCPVKWGIMGTGYMAETFSSAIDGNLNGKVFAVASRTIEKAKKFSKKHGDCYAYGSYEELAKNSDIDVIYIATPTKYHYDHIKICLLHGKNVICEKLITSNANQLKELISIAKEKKCFFMEGMWMKCLPTYQKAKEWIQENRIGLVELIRTDFYKLEKINTDYAIFNKDMDGGVLKDYGVYALAFPLGFMNEIVDFSYKKRYSKYGIDSDWTIAMFDGKIQALVNISSNFTGISKAAVIGKEGSIGWEAPFNRTNTIILYDANGNAVDKFSVHYEYEGFEYEINEVQKCIRDGLLESPQISRSSS